MALTPRPQLLHFHLRSPANPTPAPASLFLSFPISPPSLSKNDFLSAFSPVTVKLSLRTKCLRSATEEDRLSESETLSDDEAADNGDAKIQHLDNSTTAAAAAASSSSSAASTGSMRVATTSSSSYGDSLSLGIREPVYEVVEVKSDGVVSTRKINRRQLLKSSGLRPRDVRSVDPSLFLTNSMPSLLVREHAILLNLGSLRAIAMQERVLIFDYNRKGGKAFIDTLLPRLNPKNANGGPSMPFELEVVEAALLSRIQRLERRLMDLEPRVVALLEVLPNRLTADILEQLRTSKQTLVELDSRAGALKQMLLDLLEDPYEIRRICIMGRNCIIRRGSDDVECSVSLEKQIAEEEEEEIEMLLENYLQRCESCHGQAERLLDSAKEMEDSIAVNLSSRRLEVSRVELLLQVGTFCVGVGALVAGIFGMNLRSYLEEHVLAFWLTTAGIIFGAVVAFFLMYSYLRTRKIL
ncbi:magnesium transporter MRS2-11, chloroplastic [Ziziphus jujuba]|uniref:Magnesium transporter n=1 Tax=Ziziphus jujuba TaxID=326968 RepID=A0A6P3ZIS2_ZIZJJ|nr:magnesium transporter MRS2-11, chloroplastic [Ziziphus jujuba]